MTSPSGNLRGSLRPLTPSRLPVPSELRLFLVGLLMLAVVSIQAYEPTGSLEELYDLSHLARVRPDARCRMFSSYDRTGGNNDGFAGTYSKLREENGDSVIAEMEGAGCINRIWFTHSVKLSNGLLDRQGEHVRIYLDRSDEPVVDEPLEQLFSGELESFPRPLVGSALGGYYCYVPIPYRNGCKIVVEGVGVRFYQVTYTQFANATEVESFSPDLSPERREQLRQAVDAWSSPGDGQALGLDGCDILETTVNRRGNAPVDIDLPKGPHVIRGVQLELDQDSGNPLEAERIEFAWDGHESPGVDLPLSLFFGQAPGTTVTASLLAGRKGEEYYNFMPMPYRSSARIRLMGSAPFRGTMRILYEPGGPEPEELAYFHAAYFEQVPTEEGMYFPLLNTEGMGHYLGVLLVTEGTNVEPGWLEGDEVFETDEEMVIHGTGTEDYFNCGWYCVTNRLDGPGTLPLHGFPVFHRDGDRFHAAAYRWHVADPVPYRKSVNLKLEHGPQNDQAADYRSAVFFYDTRPGRIAISTPLPTGDDCIAYLEHRLCQFAFNQVDFGLERVRELEEVARRDADRAFLRGARAYLEGVRNPSTHSLQSLISSREDLESRFADLRKTEIRDHKTLGVGESTTGEIPKAWDVALQTLERAQYDLARRVALRRGFRPGDEILLEARDPWGDRAPEPFYTETEDFTNSYAKADDVHLLGKGARFTYGTDAATWARFTPEIPKTGLYEVLVIFSYGANASNTRYEVLHADGATTVALEQRGRPGTPERNHNTWHSLGTYCFPQGIDPTRGSVTLHAGPQTDVPNPDIEYRAYADAVRFVYKGSATKPEE